MPQQSACQCHAPSYPHLWASPLKTFSWGSNSTLSPKRPIHCLSKYHGLRHSGANSHLNLFILQMALEVTSWRRLKEHHLCSVLCNIPPIKQKYFLLQMSPPSYTGSAPLLHLEILSMNQCQKAVLAENTVVTQGQGGSTRVITLHLQVWLPRPSQQGVHCFIVT